jgi:hypothetical protein
VALTDNLDTSDSKDSISLKTDEGIHDVLPNGTNGGCLVVNSSLNGGLMSEG